MTITVEQGKTLKPGTLLAFGSSPNLYEVIRVEKHDKDIRIVLRRDDGMETFATQYDLGTAVLRGKVEREAAAADENPTLPAATSDPETLPLAEDRPGGNLPLSRSKKA